MHVLSSEVFAADIALGESVVETLGGTKVLVVNNDDGVTVGGAAVEATDIDASNGVIHVMSDVILPGSTITDIAANADGDIFSTLVTALTAAELAATLTGEGPYTVFAPTNDAFAALPDGTVEGLLEDIDALTNILLYHVVEGRYDLGFMIEDGNPTFTALNGGTLEVDALIASEFSVNGVDVVTPDIEASNGIVHAINAVLLPGE